MYALPARTLRLLSRQWTHRLLSYRLHRNDEHREALVFEALRFCGLALENDLADSPYWSEAPLARRLALLLYLVDRGAVERVARDGRYTYEAADDAEVWALSQPALTPYLSPTLDLIAALRAVASRRPKTGR
jgi:hypothetical protein